MKTIRVVTIVFGLAALFLLGRCSASWGSGTTTEKELEHWTCSMHPEIDLPDPGKCPKCGMDLIKMSEDNSGPRQLAHCDSSATRAPGTTIAISSRTAAGNRILTLGTLSLYLEVGTRDHLISNPLAAITALVNCSLRGDHIGHCRDREKRIQVSL